MDKLKTYTLNRTLLSFEIDNYSNQLFNDLNKPLGVTILQQIEILLFDQGLNLKKVQGLGITSKSLYGKISTSGKKTLFFKVAHNKSISNEIDAYNKLSHRPHQKVINHSFFGNYGIYLQEYYEDKHNGPLIHHTSESIINKNKDEITQGHILEQAKIIFQKIYNEYHHTLIYDIFKGQNDKFFLERFDDYFGDKLEKIENIILKDDNINNLKIKNIINKNIYVNGLNTELSLGKIINNAKNSHVNNRYGVLSHGDITESNITLNGIYFDFETGGRNSLTQDIAITLHYLFISGHYLTPKYSKSFSNINVNRDELVNKSKNKSTFIIDQTNIHINIIYNLPSIKKELINIYLKEIVEQLNNNHQINQYNFNDLLSKDLGIRFLLTKKLGSVDSNDLIMLIGMSALFSKKGYNTITNFF